MPASDLRSYTARVVIALALVAFGLLLWQLSGLVLLIFGAVVVAALLRAIVGQVVRFTRLPEGVALGVTVLVLAAGFALAMWLFGSQLAAQVATLRQTLPAAWAHFQAWLGNSPLGPTVHELTQRAQSSVSTVAARAGALAMSATGGIANMFLVLVGGIYLAAQPQLYRTGLLKLLPMRSRPAVDDALDASGYALRAWLGGQLVAMAVVGLLTGLGLWALGVPVALGLGIITALLDFVPIVGPILAAIPAILLAFTVSPEIALATLVLFVVLQQLEGHLLQPLIQQRAVDLPPALLLFSLFGIGALLGPPGVLLAAPLTVVLYVLVKRLYVVGALDTETPIPGRTAADTQVD
ncbi:Predicted PurR-regulated permease PerM [Pseudoxanthomonas sp. GM95]|uniref:AI-2E family transporter n=1 Tax=Pseudoxanthomonas sp. GM95 TaxID=1881043 RepID=UPI0008B68FAE|nr:AI-2E family transporter [Pseudoxanthomonas sp. GM95]SEM18957.1 Predicted PurR-regulated permease PerM [Pseudoxanthomonas sp. GM95]